MSANRIAEYARDSLERESEQFLTISLVSFRQEELASLLAARIDDAARVGICGRLVLRLDEGPSFRDVRDVFGTVKARMLRHMSPRDSLRGAVKEIRLYRSWSSALVIPSTLIDKAISCAEAILLP